MKELIRMSKNKITPEQFEEETINATFANKSIFTELSGENKYDVQMLEKIYEILK